jgi:hypothetical protein
MNPFQVIGVTFCAIHALQSGLRFGRRRAFVHLGFCLVWAFAAICFLFPDATNSVANSLGVTRGSDLIFYILSLIFLWAHFQHYSRYKATQRVLTDLVRAMAIQNARGPAADGVSIGR